MERFYAFAGGTLIAGVMLALMLDRSGQVPVTTAASTQLPAPPPNTNNSRSVTLSRGNGGHFWTDARIDGRRLELIIDTGASQIALRAGDAARLGIHPVPRDFTINVSTANGITRAALVQLRMVEVGNIVVRDLPALVHADESLGVNLLGMSFLSKLRWTHERGKLILEQ